MEEAVERSRARAARDAALVRQQERRRARARVRAARAALVAAEAEAGAARRDLAFWEAVREPAPATPHGRAITSRTPAEAPAGIPAETTFVWHELDAHLRKDGLR